MTGRSAYRQHGGGRVLQRLADSASTSIDAGLTAINDVTASASARKPADGFSPYLLSSLHSAA